MLLSRGPRIAYCIPSKKKLPLSKIRKITENNREHIDD
jgi:hypothetical protein